MSRRDWTQNAFAAAAAAIAGGAGLPARADEIDDKYAQIMSAAAEEVSASDANNQRAVAERTLQKLRAAALESSQEEPLAATASAPFVSTLAGPVPVAGASVAAAAVAAVSVAVAASESAAPTVGKKLESALKTEEEKRAAVEADLRSKCEELECEKDARAEVDAELVAVAAKLASRNESARLERACC